MAFYYFSFQFLQFHYYLRTSCYYLRLSFPRHDLFAERDCIFLGPLGNHEGNHYYDHEQ